MASKTTLSLSIACNARNTLNGSSAQGDHETPCRDWAFAMPWEAQEVALGLDRCPGSPRTLPSSAKRGFAVMSGWRGNFCDLISHKCWR